jgi:hypothetical protein
MNPYAAPDTPSQDPPFKLDVHLILGAVFQAATALVGGLGAIFSPMAGYMAYTEGDEIGELLGPVGSTVFYGVLGVLCFGGVAALNGAGALGVMRKKQWGWWCSAIAWVLLLPGGCLPLGVYGLWALLRAHVRRGFGVNA